MQSAPHVYLSALYWLPEESVTFRNLKLSELSHLQVIKGKRTRWDALVWERSFGRGLRCITQSPDGRHIAICGGDHCIYIMDASTGAIEGEPLQYHTSRVSCLAYSRDGKYIASGSWDETVCIWDAKSGKLAFGPFTGHTSVVTCVDWSPDGKFVASGSWDKTDRKSTRLNSSHSGESRMPSSA